MCGIIGYIGPDLDDQKLCHARDLMQSRGPDSAGDVSLSCAAGGVYLGHRRLAILDLSDAGKQPMWSDCGRYIITYNGEVYNSTDLREELKQLGRRFNSTCDTEVIVNGFAEWGSSVVERLSGMFAFGIWDTREETLFLARDRIGMKPMFIAATGGQIAFASDARVLKKWALPRH